MKVTSLEQMEQIVSKNKSLTWDGWTVVNSYPNPTAWSKPNGAFSRSRGQWFITSRFEPTETGWDIPNKFVR